MARILCIGIATLDIVNEVTCYPDEDDEIRILSQEKRRGGNATNTSVVLSQLGHQCTWAGTLVKEDSDTQIILADLEYHQINYKHCHFLNQGKIPTSYITISRQTGSRTISHYRDLSEYSFQNFKKINLHAFDWFHFEGRNIRQVQKMMQWCKQQCPETPISLEIEKPRDLITNLFQDASVLLFSKPYALSQGYESTKSFCWESGSKYPDKTIICAWGSSGAGAIHKKQYHWQNALNIAAVDTLAAGDVFNAGIIDQQIRQHSLKKCLKFANKLAGKKCEIKGISSISIK